MKYRLNIIKLLTGLIFLTWFGLINHPLNTQAAAANVGDSGQTTTGNYNDDNPAGVNDNDLTGVPPLQPGPVVSPDAVSYTHLTLPTIYSV